MTAVATVILLFLALPIVVILITSCRNNAFAAFPPDSWTLGWYKVFADGSKWPAVLSLSALGTALSAVFIIGVTAAINLTLSEPPFRSVVYALVLGPLFIPQIITALACSCSTSPPRCWAARWPSSSGTPRWPRPIAVRQRSCARGTPSCDHRKAHVHD